MHLAPKEITTATCIAVSTVAGVPADAYALSLFPAGVTLTDSVDHANNLVPGHPRILQTSRVTVLDHDITVTDPARLDSNSHPAGAGFRNFTLYDFKGSARAGNLCGTHLWHK